LEHGDGWITSRQTRPAKWIKLPRDRCVWHRQGRRSAVDEVRLEDVDTLGSTHAAGEEAHEPPEEGETVGRHRASDQQPDTAAFLPSEE
jgi:hypothetical protein